MPNLQIQSLWQTILDAAQIDGYPLNKKRALIREYLQSKFLYYLYAQKQSRQIAFIGGTALRLLHHLDRFSEDLDFDNLGLKTKILHLLLQKAADNIKKTGFSLEFRLKIQNKAGVGYLKFSDGLLYQIGASLDPKEKLLIKLDIKEPERGVEKKVYLLTEFDCVQNIMSHSLETILAQKTLAFLHRKSPRGRDIYDIFWLLIKKIEPNFNCLKRYGIKNKEAYFQTVAERYQTLLPHLKNLKKQLLPFLVMEDKIKYLDMFPKMIETQKYLLAGHPNKL